MSAVEELYLKAILSLSPPNPASPDLVKMGDLAARMQLSAGTITSMLLKLAQQGLVTYVPRQGCTLTNAGRLRALSLLRKHRLIETFLLQHLGYDWSEVHSEAEQLQHAVSDRFINRIDALMGYPKRDPHGSPIPDPDLNLLQSSGKTLSECSEGETVVLERVSNEDREFLVWLAKNGITPGALLRIERRQPSAQVMEIGVNPGQAGPTGTTACTLSMSMTGYLYVRELGAQ